MTPPDRQAARAARVTTADLSAVARRAARQAAFKRHVGLCARCGDNAVSMCPDGHRLLREALTL